MRKAFIVAVSSLTACASLTAGAAEDPCGGFKWPVPHERSLFAGDAAKTAGGSEAAVAAHIETDKLYEVALPAQKNVHLAVPPAKKMLGDGAHAALIQVAIPKAGRYRVSLDLPFWVDVVRDGELVRSRDFSGSPGCNTPHKVVEYDLPAAGDYLIQVSGATEKSVRIAVTATSADAGMQDLGQAVFNTQWVPAGTSDAGRRDGLGPFFNAAACDACHNDGARARAPVNAGPAPAFLVMQLAVPASRNTPAGAGDPRYGHVLSTSAIAGVSPEAIVGIRYGERTGKFPDGEAWRLRVPDYRITRLAYGPLGRGTVIKPRLAPAVFGVGLLEAVPAEAIEAVARSQRAAGDGIAGEVSRVRRDGLQLIGRFGWQAGTATVREQTTKALAQDMGITSAEMPADDCTTFEATCRAAPAGGNPEASEEFVAALVLFQNSLALPRPLTPPAADDGAERLFSDSGCARCHQPEYEIPSPDGNGAARLKIQPYTDLLLHDLGAGLADRDARGRAVASRWRTAPLWGLGYSPRGEAERALLHDGRARSVTEAILWHDGEALSARERFEHLARADRQRLVAWVLAR